MAEIFDKNGDFEGFTCLHDNVVLNQIHTNPRTPLHFHFIQLSLHHGQLPAENYGTDDAGRSDYGSQNDHPPIASINSIYKRLIGYGCLGSVFVFCYFGMLFLICHDRWPRLNNRISLTLGVMFFLISIAFAGQGIALVFNGP